MNQTFDLISYVLVVIMGMLIFSGLTFVVEKDANPGTINIVVYISLKMYVISKAPCY